MFSVVAEPIFRLFRRGRSSGGDLAHGEEKTGEEKGFRWAQEQERAMERLKAALVSASSLKTLYYSPEEDGFVGRIVLGVDACGLGFGAILKQEGRSGKRHPVRYESSLLTPMESRYDAVKLECRELLRAVKKFRYYL